MWQGKISTLQLTGKGENPENSEQCLNLGWPAKIQPPPSHPHPVFLRASCELISHFRLNLISCQVKNTMDQAAHTMETKEKGKMQRTTTQVSTRRRKGGTHVKKTSSGRRQWRALLGVWGVGVCVCVSGGVGGWGLHPAVGGQGQVITDT